MMTMQATTLLPWGSDQVMQNPNDLGSANVCTAIPTSMAARVMLTVQLLADTCNKTYYEQ